MEDLSIITPSTGALGVYAFVEEINACLHATPYSSIMDFTAGRANGEYLVGETTLSAESIIEVLKDDIAQNCNGAKEYAYSIDVKFYKGTMRDIVEVMFTIRKPDGENITTTHQFR